MVELPIFIKQEIKPVVAHVMVAIQPKLLHYRLYRFYSELSIVCPSKHFLVKFSEGRKYI